MTSQAADPNSPLLRIYAYYRVILSSLLLLMFNSGLAPNILGTLDARLFSYTVIGYTLLNTLTLFILRQKRFNPTSEQVFSLLFIDILALILMIHASGGLASGLGFLLLIATATGGIFLSTQVSVALAAMGSIFLLVEALYSINNNGNDSRSLFSAGSLGTMLFAASLTFNYLSRKLRQSTAETAIQTEHAAHLEKLARLIIERMQTGIVVSNPSGQVDLINQSAATLLDWQKPETGTRHLQDRPELEEHVKLWRTYPHSRAPNLITNNQKNSIRLRFANLATDTTSTDTTGTTGTTGTDESEILIFVEDNRALTREAQQLKLASLGRLTASIAHEIRNPLGAISHAGQLLSESPELNSADQRLTEIIETNAQRVNQIIENVLQLSRRRTTKPGVIDLKQWLKQFLQDYRENHPAAKIKLQLLSPHASTRIDSSHLAQVLTNLIDNGLRYSERATGEARVLLNASIDPTTELPFIEVIDDGDGIAEDSQMHIFEPFYTTEASGSGLGLYLSKELCEANHASLHYCKDSGSKSCFRIDFSHPDRMF